MRHCSFGFYFPLEKNFFFQTLSECKHEIKWSNFCPKCFQERKPLSEKMEEIQNILKHENFVEQTNFECFCQKDEKRREETQNILLATTTDLKKFSLKKMMDTHMYSHEFFYDKLGKYTKESFYLQFRESFFFFVFFKFCTQKQKCTMCKSKIFSILQNFLQLVEESFFQIWEIIQSKNKNWETDIYFEEKSQCLIYYIFSLKTFLHLVWTNCQMKKDEIKNIIYIPVTFFEQFVERNFSRRFREKVKNPFLEKYFENSQHIGQTEIFSEIELTFP